VAGFVVEPKLIVDVLVVVADVLTALLAGVVDDPKLKVGNEDVVVVGAAALLAVGVPKVNAGAALDCAGASDFAVPNVNVDVALA
jgi:hypothetical protein